MRNGQQTIPMSECKRAYDCYLAHGESVNATAQALGISRASVRTRLDRYANERKSPGIILPDFPPSEAPIEDIIARRREQSKMRRESYEAHTWFPIKVTDKLPIGIMWFGDPHMDDDGCNWDAMYEHVELCKTPGVFGVNIGDVTNNWTGRLLAKYAEQATTITEARRMASWFLLDSGIRWLTFILGNHDAWNDGAAILSEMAKRHGTQKIIMHDWEARFALNFPNGVSIKVWAAHDFPGDSMWNPMHGAIKAARFGPQVDLLVCGHKHHWGISQWELGDKGTCPMMIRARGYKFNDEYARRIGKIEQNGGCSIFTVIDPTAPPEGRITAFADPAQGVKFLSHLRGGE